MKINNKYNSTNRELLEVQLLKLSPQELIDIINDINNNYIAILKDDRSALIKIDLCFKSNIELSYIMERIIWEAKAIKRCNYILIH